MSSAALTSIEVEGWKSIRSAKVELRAINVLIGANGAGKSNLISLFGFFGAVVDRRMSQYLAKAGGANVLLHYGAKRTPTLIVKISFDLGQTYECTFAASADDTLRFAGGRYRKEVGELSWTNTVWPFTPDDPDQLPGIDPIAAMLPAVRVFHFHDTSTFAPTKVTQQVDDNQFLRAEGENIAPFLYALRHRAAGAYRRIVEAVRSVAPFFDDFELKPEVLNSSNMRLGWRHVQSDAAFFANSLSDGTLRFICLATLLLQPELPSLIVIDEPELGLHPFAISKLAAMVRAAATKTQVILATQSVTLLDQFEPPDVIVAEQKDGESTFRRLDEASLKDWLADYSLGDLWLKNVLGGRPA